MNSNSMSSPNKKTTMTNGIQLDIVESWLAKNAKHMNKSQEETKSFTCWRQFG